MPQDDCITMQNAWNGDAARVGRSAYEEWRDVTWHFFKTRGTHTDGTIKGNPRLMVDE